MDTTFAGQIVPSVSIANLLSQRDAIIERIGKAIGLLKEAEQLAQSAGIADPDSYRSFERMLAGEDSCYGSRNLMQAGALPQITERVDAGAWGMLMHASGLVSLMDSGARQRLREQIDKTTHRHYGGPAPTALPPLTASNIEATFRQLYDSRGDMFDQGVIACFKKLSWDYKTNKPFKFGKRIVFRMRQYGHFDHERVNMLADLQRVFHIFDGQPEEDHRTGIYSRLSAYHSKDRGEHDDTYMHIRWFKNGNSHITFKRPDLIERCNQIIAKHFPGALAYDQHAEG